MPPTALRRQPSEGLDETGRCDRLSLVNEWNPRLVICWRTLYNMISLSDDMISSLQVKAKFYRGLADPTRLGILECLLAGEKSVTEIVEAAEQSQSNISNHLKCLMDCGLVANSRDGKHVLYRVRDRGVSRLLESGDRVVSKIYSDIARCVRYEE